jgi:hypothetical protein
VRVKWDAERWRRAEAQREGGGAQRGTARRFSPGKRLGCSLGGCLPAHGGAAVVSLWLLAWLDRTSRWRTTLHRAVPRLSSRTDKGGTVAGRTAPLGFLRLSTVLSIPHTPFARERLLKINARAPDRGHGSDTAPTPWPPRSASCTDPGSVRPRSARPGTSPAEVRCRRREPSQC